MDKWTSPPAWIDGLVASECKSPYQQRRCATALAVVLEMLRTRVEGVDDELTWRQRVSAKLLTSMWSEYGKASPPRSEAFWVRRVVSLLLRRLHEARPFGIGPVQVDSTKPRVRLSMEHCELWRDITRELPEWTASRSTIEGRSIRRFIASYPVWDMQQLSEVTLANVEDWCAHRFPIRQPPAPIVGFLNAWQARHGTAPARVEMAIKRPLYCSTFPAGLPMHVAVFWGFYFRNSCDDFIARLHTHLDTRHLKGVHRSQIIEAIKTFVHDICAQHNLRGHDWETDVQPAITIGLIETWLVKQATLRCHGGCSRLPTVLVRHVVAMNHFADLLWPDHHQSRNSFFCRSQIQRRATLQARGLQPLGSHPTTIDRTYTQEEVDALFKATQCRRDRLLLLLLTRVGLRSAALRGLLVENMSGGRREGMALEKGSRWHHFFIDNATQQCMQGYLAHEHPDQHSPFLFPHNTHYHKAMPSSQLRSWLLRLACRAGIAKNCPYITIHSFRRYVVTTLLENKNSMEYVARYIGHASANTTSRYWMTSPTHLVTQMNIPWSTAISTVDGDAYTVVSRALLHQARAVCALASTDEEKIRAPLNQ